jgi:hypothetical protein
MPGNKHKGQTRDGLALTLVVVGVALVVGIFIFATISPTLLNTNVVNESLGNFSGAGTTLCFDQPPAAPGAVDTVITFANCSNASLGSCTTLLSNSGGNWTLDASRSCITSVTALEVGGVNYTSGYLPTNGQTAGTAISNNTFTAFTLAAVVLIVIAAAAILRNLSLFG